MSWCPVHHFGVFIVVCSCTRLSVHRAPHACARRAQGSRSTVAVRCGARGKGPFYFAAGFRRRGAVRAPPGAKRGYFRSLLVPCVHRLLTSCRLSQTYEYRCQEGCPRMYMYIYPVKKRWKLDQTRPSKCSSCSQSSSAAGIPSCRNIMRPMAVPQL